MELMAAKKLPEAERLLRQAIALDPDDGMPPAALALVLDGDGRQSEAVVSARAALAVYERRAQNGDEDNPDRASLMRSVAYYLIGKAEAAAARDAKANISERAAAAGRARDALTRSMSIRPNGKARELLDSLSARPAP
jgi:tetratricopeptide (TPR) repeat protein